jgi:hypothetical protein
MLQKRGGDWGLHFLTMFFFEAQERSLVWQGLGSVAVVRLLTCMKGCTVSNRLL